MQSGISRRRGIRGTFLLLVLVCPRGLPAQIVVDPPKKTIVEYPLPPSLGRPTSLTIGPDGAVWFTSLAGNSIGRRARDGTLTAFPLPTPNCQPDNILIGPDGNFWFTMSSASKIGKITQAGNITEYSIHSNGIAQSIAFGSDGGLWFSDPGGGGDRIGRLDPREGTVTFYPFAFTGIRGVVGMAAGPDGNLWFTEAAQEGQRIGRITPGASITEFPLPNGGGPWDIVVGPDRALWFAEAFGDRIGRITIDGAILEYRLRFQDTNSRYITAGPDGALWFAQGGVGRIGRITTGGDITDFQLPTAQANVSGIAASSTSVWMTEYLADGTPGQLAMLDLCAPSGGACLQGGRFTVRVTWRTQDGTTGTATSLSMTPDTTAFWFFSPNNIEVVVKVVDGRSVNGHFWVFAAGLSDVEYTITVLDQETTLSTTFHNDPGHIGSYADTTRF